jgi:cytochrome c oxidase subunit III
MQQVIPHEHAAAGHADAHHGAPVFAPANHKLAMWLFLSSEIMFFSVLIAVYVWARFAHPEEHALLNVPVTSVNSLILLMSSYMVVRALSAVQEGNRKRFMRSLIINMVMGIIFFVIMMVEYTELSHHGVTLNSGPFGFAFFSLTGFHGIHVLIGLIWLASVIHKGMSNVYNENNYLGVELYGLYWHFVDVVWIFIFTIVYLI